MLSVSLLQAPALLLLGTNLAPEMGTSSPRPNFAAAQAQQLQPRFAYTRPEAQVCLWPPGCYLMLPGVQTDSGVR